MEASSTLRQSHNKNRRTKKRKHRTILQKLLVYKMENSLWVYITELKFLDRHELSHRPAGVGGPPIEKHWYKLYSERTLNRVFRNVLNTILNNLETVSDNLTTRKSIFSSIFMPVDEN
jgi:hypothetical protein